MNPADETAGKIEATERQLAGAVAGSDDKVDELRVAPPQERTGQDYSDPSLNADEHGCLARFQQLSATLLQA
jgi:hypothetical protein